MPSPIFGLSSDRRYPLRRGIAGHLLKNRFYIGEVTYRGAVHRGEHEPILTRDLFEAVQDRRAANAVAQQVRLRGSAAVLAGRLFDDRGNRMSPAHANKHGVRYRYYVAGAFAESQGRGWQHRPRAGPRDRDSRARWRPQASCSDG